MGAGRDRYKRGTPIDLASGTIAHGPRAHLLHHQARRDRAEPHRRRQRGDRGRRPAHRRAEAHAHDPPRGRNLLCGSQGASLLRRTRRLHDLRPGRRAGARRRERRRQATARSWAPRTRRTPPPARSASSSPSRSARTRSTAPTASTTPRPRSPSSSRATRSSARSGEARHASSQPRVAGRPGGLFAFSAAPISMMRHYSALTTMNRPPRDRAPPLGLPARLPVRLLARRRGDRRARRSGACTGPQTNRYTAGVICAKVARYAERIHHPGPAAPPAEADRAEGLGPVRAHRLGRGPRHRRPSVPGGGAGLRHRGGLALLLCGHDGPRDARRHQPAAARQELFRPVLDDLHHHGVDRLHRRHRQARRPRSARDGASPTAS